MAASVGLLLLLLIFTVCVILTVSPTKPDKKKIYYVDIEHINLTYWNPKYVRDPKVYSQRVNRSDPLHYFNVHAEVLVPIGNNVLLDVYVYEFLSNEYRRSFVEFHMKACDMMTHEIFGPVLAMFLPSCCKTCPFPKGVYDIRNMYVPDLPLLHTFPFQKGRVFLNSTITGPDGVRERLHSGFGDAAIKQRFV